MNSISKQKFEYRSGSPEETLSLGKKLSKCLYPGCVLTLIGDLGAGKTLFTSGIAKGLGIDESITSPTFNILKVYEEGTLSLYHVDAYRLKDGNRDIGLEDYIYGDGITAVEWPEFIEELLPEERIAVRIVPVDENTRLFEFEAVGGKSIEALEKLEELL